ncbi:MAG: toll/interleukin-1 receptor domain-containing protein, partial [Lysobacterales bacterium]
MHYKAFISYSHQDESWARWLQASLEGYRVPRRLVGNSGQFGEIPARLTPIFRDREDLSSAADLSSQIKRELEASETLIVICSPAAATSRWVSEEIRYFRTLGRDDRILALIVAGDPQSGDPVLNCFPPALVQRLDGQQYEPLAADARRYADGKALSRLKLVAGILGIRLDDLRRRDAQR